MPRSRSLSLVHAFKAKFVVISVDICDCFSKRSTASLYRREPMSCFIIKSSFLGVVCAADDDEGDEDIVDKDLEIAR